MYKVFFGNRTAILVEDSNGVFRDRTGLFYRFRNIEELQELLDSYFEMEQIGNLSIFHHDTGQLVDAFRSCFTCIEAGGGVVRNPRGEFLVIERNGVWDLPKGKLEKGEDFETAALREVEEETGLRGLELLQPLTSTFHTYRLSGHKVLKETRWFEMSDPGISVPVLQSEEGITRHKWAKPGHTGFIRKNSYVSILDVLKTRDLL